MNKKAQEEMIGFALIIVLVAVILLVFLSFSLRNPEKKLVESYEVESFVLSFLQYTTDCESRGEPRSIQKLISDCDKEKMCEDEKEACEVLNSTINELLKESWKIGENRPIKGYNLEITSGEKEMIKIDEGNKTRNSKGFAEYLPEDVSIIFEAYY